VRQTHTRGGRERTRTDAGTSDGFATSPEYTVGVEEEFMVLDPRTRGLVSRGHELVRAARDPDIKLEIRQSMVETSTRPAATTAELAGDLVRLRARVTGLAERRGLRVAAAGTHPFSSAEAQDVTNKPRYRYVAGVSGWVGRRATAVFGTHVHVAVGSLDKALGVIEALLPDLPALVALSASSPLWGGQDTGFASSRLAVRAELPRTGLPPHFVSGEHYRSTLEQLRTSGLVPDASYLWWDVRIQERYGTIEVRLLDAQPSVHDTVALASLVRGLVMHHGARWDEGHHPVADRLLVGENRWQALRHGLAGDLVVDGSARSVRGVLDDLLARAAPHLDEAGRTCDHVSDLADRGGRATELRELFLISDDPAAVVDRLADLNAADVVRGHEASDVRSGLPVR
jgi:carboxylate-amine ligase